MHRRLSAKDDGSVTSTKPAESFMKRVTPDDTPAGNAEGWNPNGAFTTFGIEEELCVDDEQCFVSIRVFAVDSEFDLINHFCDVIDVGFGFFDIVCFSAPGEGAILDYVVENLPAHVS